MKELHCCLGEVNRENTKLHLYASTGCLGPTLEFHEINILNDGTIIYYRNGHKTEKSAECDNLMEKFLRREFKIIA
jgi:hypothetical protein